MSLCNTADVTVVEQHKRMHVKLKNAHRQKQISMCMSLWQKDIFAGQKLIMLVGTLRRVKWIFPSPSRFIWLIQKHQRTRLFLQPAISMCYKHSWELNSFASASPICTVPQILSLREIIFRLHIS